MNKYFLWPSSDLIDSRFIFGKHIDESDIEIQISDLFPSSNPVLFSTARAGLACVMQLLEVGRRDLIWVPPFSSHCVIEAVARTGTPSSTDISSSKASLIYHQWGFLHTHSFRKNAILIEDSVDTFFTPGSSPFSIGGEFSLWSLPKVIGSLCGGVVFCKDHGTAERLREIREKRRSAQFLQMVLRGLSKKSPLAANYWHGFETNGGGLPKAALRQIQFILSKKFEHILNKRIHILKILQNEGFEIKLEFGRFPSNIPICIKSTPTCYWEDGGIFSAGLRNFNTSKDFGNPTWTRVAPLPIHHSVDEIDLLKLPLRKIQMVE